MASSLEAESEDGHGGAALGGGKAFEQDGLGDGLKGSAAGALYDAEEEKEAERGGGSTGEAGYREDGDADHEEALASEAKREPVGGWEDDGVGD